MFHSQALRDLLSLERPNGGEASSTFPAGAIAIGPFPRPAGIPTQLPFAAAILRGETS
jgi:hypothetical protein